MIVTERRSCRIVAADGFQRRPTIVETLHEFSYIIHLTQKQDYEKDPYFFIAFPAYTLLGGGNSFHPETDARRSSRRRPAERADGSVVRIPGVSFIPDPRDAVQKQAYSMTGMY